jgi:hypothetical protein
MGRIIKRHYCLLVSTGFALVILAGCAPQPGSIATAPAPVAALEPGMARFWVLRQPSSPGGNIAASDPMVYVNGAPLGQSARGTAYFHDFLPGTYRFTVQAYGTPTNYIDTLQLTAGMETYVQVEPVPNWEVGSTSGSASFIVATMPQQEALQYMPMMKDLGQR